jgi:hypothetical protein
MSYQEEKRAAVRDAIAQADRGAERAFVEHMLADCPHQAAAMRAFDIQRRKIERPRKAPFFATLFGRTSPAR